MYNKYVWRRAPDFSIDHIEFNRFLSNKMLNYVTIDCINAILNICLELCSATHINEQKNHYMVSFSFNFHYFQS